MKRLLFGIMFLFFLQGYSQVYEDLYIQFSYKKSSIIGENIDVYLYNSWDSTFTKQKYTAKVIFHRFRKDIEKEYPISKEEHLKICKAVFKIKSKDVATEVRSCLDANYTQIGIAEFGRDICTYNIHCLSEQDANTKWKDYYNASLLILKTVNLKFSDL